MGYGISPNASHFTGKRRGKTQNNRRKRVKVKREHKNKYASEPPRQQERRWGEMFGKPVRPRGTDSARVIQVIESKSLRGAGTEEDPCRKVTQYWDYDGNLLAENDPCAKEKE